MGYRILADENIERATIRSLRKLDHDVEWIGDVDALGLGTDDERIVTYAESNDRLILTQDDDFLAAIDAEHGPGVLFQTEESLTAREVGDIVHELSVYVPQSSITLEYVSRNWL